MQIFFFLLLKEPSIFLANVEWFCLPCCLNNPFFIFMIPIQSNTGTKSSEARAEDQMLNKLGMKLDLFSPMALVFLLDAIPYLSYTSMTSKNFQ